MIREIAPNQLLQEELAKIDPNLVCVAAFMNKVCGTDRWSLKLKERVEAWIQRGMTTREEAAAPIVSVVESTERGEGIVAPTIQFVSNEMDAPSAVAIGEAPVVEARVAEAVANACDATAALGNKDVEGEGSANQRPDESDTISLTDTVMYIGGLSSDGFQSHSTCGSSVSVSGSRKRAADESKNEGTSRLVPRTTPRLRGV